MEGQKCPRCGDADLEVDDQDGFLLCRACGFVAEDLGQLGGGPEPGTGGVYVGAEDDGSRAAGALSAAMSSRYHPDAAAASGSSTLGRHVGSRGKGAMEAAEKLKGLGSTLGLPQRVIADAVAMLAEVRDGRLVHVGGPMNTGDAQLAGLLFLAARSASLPLTLSRAASAAQADRHAAGTQFRWLCHALRCQLPLPSTSLRAQALRITTELLRMDREEGGRGEEEEEEEEEGEGVRRSSSGQEAGQLPALQQPLVREALAVVELVEKMAVGEGRTPAVMAGAAVLVVVEGHPPAKLLLSRRPTMERLSEVAGCNALRLRSARKHLMAQLLQLASLLPSGGLISEANLASYLPLVASMVHTMVQLKRGEEPGSRG
ncbi:hypothetical protein QJQ45_021978 [Haematococcus lacustris]|nr:hypothetical protein QJQ45_021978 [Haematococcus lacustris]